MPSIKISQLCVSKISASCFRHFTMSHSCKKHIIGICQVTATSDKGQNFESCKQQIENAVSKGAKMVFLPECCDFIGSNRQQTLELAEDLNGPTVNRYKELAQRLGVWLSLGGIHEKGPESDCTRIYNTHVVLDSSGTVVSTYRKMHMFDIEIAGKVSLRESDYTIPGTAISSPIATPVGKIGLGICYDMRFPEMGIVLRQMGADILTFPSTFTVPTGKAHWEVLLRARAIETQCYVVASAQVGKHNDKRSSYGHALVVDPWGSILECCNTDTRVAVAEIDHDVIARVRSEMPVMHHRRPDMYGALYPCRKTDHDRDAYMFGPHPIKSEFVIYRSHLSFAFVNRKPVLPGHILVASIRQVEKLEDLTQAEIADMFSTAQTIEARLAPHYNATSATIAVQDGVDAGQSVTHVHVHVLPRKPNDFQANDDVYEKLEKHDKGPESERQWRTHEEMLTEATELAKLFH